MVFYQDNFERTYNISHNNYCHEDSTFILSDYQT